MTDLTPWLDRIHHIDALDLLRQLPDDSVDMVLTDMPYGTTACSWDTVIDLAAWWTQVWRVLKLDRAVVCTASQPFTTTLAASSIAQFRYEWVWHKNTSSGFLDANRKPLKTHENILVFAQGTCPYHPQKTTGKPYNKKSTGTGQVYSQHQLTPTINTGTRYPRSILKFNVEQRALHPTQKPARLFDYLIRTYTRPGEIILDPFIGSGTTALAARAVERHYIGGDTSTEYVQLARDRLEQTDPYAPTRYDDGSTQLTLFGSMEDDDDE